MKSALSSPRWQVWKTPLLYFGAVLLSYGIWIPWMGLYGDDLSYLWYYHLLGAWGPGQYAAIDRPASAVFYALVMSALGETVWSYHVLLLVLRWISALLLMWVVCLVWTEHKRAAIFAGLFLAVYPGFRQNPIALEFILHFFVLDLALLSIAASLQMIQQPARFWQWGAVAVIGAAGVFLLEYFIGLEVLRLILLVIVLRQMGSERKTLWRLFLKVWLPTTLVMIAFLFWRVVIFSFPTYKPVLLEALRAHPLTALKDLLVRIAQDVWVSLGGAWLQTTHFPPVGSWLWLNLGLIALTLLGLAGWLWWNRKAPQEPSHRRWGLGLASLGLLTMLAGGLIFWLTNIPLSLDFPWDRTTLALMIGASLLLAGLLEVILPPRIQWAAVAGLVALAVGMHAVNAQEYRVEGQKLQNFFWQLAWRAPQLTPGSLLLFDIIPLNRTSDNDLTAMLNWTYHPAEHSPTIAYKFFDLTLRLDGGAAGLPGTQKGLPVVHNQRGTFFSTTTNQTVALAFTPPACLKILDPSTDNALPDLPERLARVLPMTSLAQIQPADAAARPPAQLGAEPAHTWCYFFEQADLARQMHDWAQITKLGDSAFTQGFQPADPAELLPFIEGYARSGQVQKAQALTQQALKSQPNLQSAACSLWSRAGQAAEFSQARAQLHCPAP